MHENIGQEVALLKQMTVSELQTRYAEVFGEGTQTGNKTWLVKRIAWRLQALAEGDLSERARQRAAELANDADLRLSPPKHARTASPEATQLMPAAALSGRWDHRLPPPGNVLTRLYKGRTLQIRILQEGFAYEGQIYPSLSALAKAITGTHTNGFLFFRLCAKGATRWQLIEMALNSTRRASSWSASSSI